MTKTLFAQNLGQEYLKKLGSRTLQGAEDTITNAFVQIIFGKENKNIRDSIQDVSLSLNFARGTSNTSS